MFVLFLESYRSTPQMLLANPNSSGLPRVTADLLLQKSASPFRPRGDLEWGRHIGRIAFTTRSITTWTSH